MPKGIRQICNPGNISEIFGRLHAESQVVDDRFTIADKAVKLRVKGSDYELFFRYESSYVCFVLRVKLSVFIHRRTLSVEKEICNSSASKAFQHLLHIIAQLNGCILCCEIPDQIPMCMMNTMCCFLHCCSSLHLYYINRCLQQSIEHGTSFFQHLQVFLQFFPDSCI